MRPRTGHRERLGQGSRELPQRSRVLPSVLGGCAQTFGGGVASPTREEPVAGGLEGRPSTRGLLARVERPPLRGAGPCHLSQEAVYAHTGNPWFRSRETETPKNTTLSPVRGRSRVPCGICALSIVLSLTSRSFPPVEIEFTCSGPVRIGPFLCVSRSIFLLARLGGGGGRFYGFDFLRAPLGAPGEPRSSSAGRWRHPDRSPRAPAPAAR